jgi:hypothetical protein
VPGALLACIGLPACGHILTTVQASSAQNRFDEARELGAEEHAPYEFYLAREHLEKAKSEAAEADYEDAARLSSAAEQYATRAIELTRAAHRGPGP